MDTTTEATVGTDDLYQQLLHLSDVELLFWGCVLVMALLSLNSIIINIKGLVQEIQENPDTHVPGVRLRFAPIRGWRFRRSDSKAAFPLEESCPHF